MSSSEVYMICGTLLFFMGAAGIVFCGTLLRKALALNVAGTGIFLFLVARAYNGPDSPPDPVPHALVLTGIVIAASATALLLFLVTQLAETNGPDVQHPPPGGDR
jgi:multicomponent Na+:H+ antiporter subunit C